MAGSAHPMMNGRQRGTCPMWMGSDLTLTSGASLTFSKPSTVWQRTGIPMMTIIIEAIIYSLLYTAFMLVLFMTQEEMDANAKRNKIMSSLVMVVDTIWFCHSKWWIIPGTEDMVEAYHDYAFHWKWFFLGLLTILPVSLIIGGIVALIGLI